MFVCLVKHKPEIQLLVEVEECLLRNGAWGALYFRFSAIGAPAEAELIETIYAVLGGQSATLYRWPNGDAVITWSGAQQSVLGGLCRALYGRFAPNASEELHRYYDMQAQADELREFFAPPPAAEPLAPPPNFNGQSLLEFVDSHQARFAAAVANRAMRRVPLALIIEDQPFSGRLLSGILERQDCTVRLAHTAMEGLDLYAGEAPDILYLDLELPDGSGHDVAAAIQRFDPHAAIVIVTVNHSAEDVARARANGARAFIVKPYNKQKILDSLALLAPSRRRESPCVDLYALRDMTGGDSEMERLLFDEFFATFDTGVAMLKALCSDDSLPRWRVQAHALRGVALNLGAARLGELCQDAQQGQSTPQKRREIAAAIGVEYARVRDYLRQQAAA